MPAWFDDIITGLRVGKNACFSRARLLPGWAEVCLSTASFDEKDPVLPAGDFGKAAEKRPFPFDIICAIRYNLHPTEKDVDN